MSATLSPPSATLPPQSLPARATSETFPDRVWGMLRCFRSVHLAIVLISLLAVATLVGVLIPQEGVMDTLQLKKQYGANYRLMKAMGLFSVYSSYWFIALETLFFFNLLFGSFQWLRPAFRAATRKTFCGPEHILASPHRLGFSASGHSLGETVAVVTDTLKRHRYRVHTAGAQADGSVRLYACKGNFSRFGPVVAHAGILLMLVASVYGAFTGFKAQHLAVPGDTFGIQDAQMFRPSMDESLWQGSVPDWKIRVNDFRIEYYPEGQAPDRTAVVKQYYADLSVLNVDGQETKRETISVNHPLVVGDTMIYQASFNPTGKLFLTMNGQPKTVKVNTEFMNRRVAFEELSNGLTLMAFPFFVQQDPDVTRNYVVLFLRDEHGFVGARPGEMPPNLRLLEGESGQLHGIRFTYEKPEIATGLQIKKGPEVPWMYLSYIIIIIGTVMCVFSQRRLWLAITPAEKNSDPNHSAEKNPNESHPKVYLFYKTNKARLSFMKELQRMQTVLNARLNAEKGASL